MQYQYYVRGFFLHQLWYCYLALLCIGPVRTGSLTFTVSAFLSEAFLPQMHEGFFFFLFVVVPPQSVYILP